MPRTFLRSGETTDAIGGINSVSEIFGTNDAENVTLNANARAVLDSSFGRGNDNVYILGNAASYSAKLSGSNIILTSTNGANITIGAGTGGTSIHFLDADRTLVIGSSGMFLGNQAITSTVTAVLPGGPDPSGNGGAELYLEVARDVLTTAAKGVTDGDDTFIADLVQNSFGAQTNTLGTGDRLNGLGGTDTLLATIQDASPLNGGPGSSIAPITSSVEVIYVTAQQAYDGYDESDDSIALGVELNAKQMTGVTDFGSVFSDTSLTVYNANTLPSGAAIGDESGARRTGAITVRMDHTGPASPTDDAANLTVLFDNDYLRADDSVTSGATLNVEMMDLDSAIRDDVTHPLLNNPYTSFVFKVGDTTITVPIQASSDTYEKVLADFQAALAANPATAGKVTAAIGANFVANDTDTDPGGSAVGKTIVLTNSGSETLSAVQFVAANGVPTDLDFHLQTYNGAPTTVDKLITVEVELDKVGRGGDGGYLTVGGMTTVDEHYDNSIADNTWKYGAIIHPGVEQFNVHVEGTSSEPSSLAGIQSTHNALRVVNVDNANSSASLTIGNSQTEHTSYVNGALNSYLSSVDVSDVRNNAMKDVLVFNAAAFTANSAVWAYFSDEATDKYLNNTDTAENRLLDNAHAAYTFGGGDNFLNVNFSKDNVATVGNATREDFLFKASMGAGNDHVQLQIGNGMGGGEAGNDASWANDWYVNHVINSFDDSSSAVEKEWQIAVDTGSGNDIVELWGSTAAHVVLGSGDDVVYTDNSGESNYLYNEGHATWVFNNRAELIGTFQVSDLQSFAPSTNVSGIGNLGLRVSFQGIESHLAIATSTLGANGGTVNDLTIVQLIKDAINNDPVLSHLLVAEDGPGRTLVVRSLVDGENAETDLDVWLESSGSLTAQQIANGVVLFSSSTAFLTNNGFGADGQELAGSRFEELFVNDGGALTGIDSWNVNNNVVEGGTGNDLFVLSSNGVGDNWYYGPNYTRIENDGASVETIDINGAFGEDVALNFTAAVGSSGVAEVQTITYTGTAGAAGTAHVVVNGNTYDVAIAAGATAAQVATAVAAAIGGSATATASGGVVTLTYTPVGVNYGDATATIVPTTPTTEVQSITFATNQTNAATLVVDFPAGSGLADIALTIAAGSTPSTVAQQVADAINGQLPGAATVDGAGKVTYTFPVEGDVAATIVGISSTLVDMNATVAEVTKGSVYGMTAAEHTVVNGMPAAAGWDIFDVTTVLGGAVTSVLNHQPGNGAEPDGSAINENGALQYALSNARSVSITDTVMGSGDYTGPGTAPATELGRIQNMVRADDTTASASAFKSLVITVDADNRGYFYLISNGTAVGDATAEYLGSVELGTYDLAGKEEIGNWDLMTLANFTPLTAQTVVNTFDHA